MWEVWEAWHFDAKFVDGQGHEMANVKKAAGHGYFFRDEELGVPLPL